MTIEVQTILSELKARLVELYGERLERLVLFGSQARGDAEPDSDIDVLVVLRGEVRRYEESQRISELRADLSLRHGTVVSCMFVSIGEYTEGGEALFANARREGIMV
jgi:predicted nucleotidyltransferase